MLSFLIPAEVSRNFMSGSRFLIEWEPQGSSSPSRERLKQNDPTTHRLRFSERSRRLLEARSLAHKGLALPHCMQDILPSYHEKNFSDLALLAMQHDRRAFQNTLSLLQCQLASEMA